MSERRLYYVTNRRHQSGRGHSRWNPKGYGPDFSSDGQQNLRFGRVFVKVDEAKVRKHVKADTKDGPVDGAALSSYFARRAAPRHSRIEAYPESIDKSLPDDVQAELRLGSQAMFKDVHAEMLGARRDVIVFIHGYNVSWKQAVGSALALQESFSRGVNGVATGEDPIVVLFTWPSDGQALPYTSYRSDRVDAAGSGACVARAFLKLRDILNKIVPGAPEGMEPCHQEMHLLCHSMGNYVLQKSLEHVEIYTGARRTRLFDRVFLVAADVDDDALEPSGGLWELAPICRSVGVYHSREDRALVVSDKTKNNPERLGHQGAARPDLIHRKVYHVNCADVSTTIVGHSYFLGGHANRDIRESLFGVDEYGRPERSVHRSARGWRLRPAQ